MRDPLAYLLTWTCYGTWLHGDGRGSVDVEHNIPGEPWLPESEQRVIQEFLSLKNPPVVLDLAARDLVRKTIEDHCRIRKWELMALNVRTNHVHVVVSASSTSPERAMNEFKAWSTRRLHEAGLLRQIDHVWTRHGSTRYLNHPSAVESAVTYVLERQ